MPPLHNNRRFVGARFFSPVLSVTEETTVKSHRRIATSETISHRFLLVLILLVGAWLRFDALTQDVRFHPDEALFATFARDAAVHGQWMFPGALDKPPLSLYAAALSMHSVGIHLNPKGVFDLDLRVGEFAARLPSAFAGILSIVLTYSLVLTLTRQRDAALIAALLMALSPFHAAFSATAFTDSLMLVCGLASLVMAARGRPAWAGVWLALSVWSKQQGVFLLPLVLWLVNSTSPPNPLSNWAKQPFRVTSQRHDPVSLERGNWLLNCIAFLRHKPVPSPSTGRVRVGSRRIFPVVVMIATFAFGIAMLLVWDAARASSQQATSLFALAAVNNNPERTFIRPDELLPRLAVWGSYLGTFFGTPLLTVGLLSVGMVAMPREMWRRIAPVAGFCALYLLTHWLVAFNLYDRYLLPLVPLLSVVVGVGVASLIQRVPIMLGDNTKRRSDVGTTPALSGISVLPTQRTRLSASLQIVLIGLVTVFMLVTTYPPRYPTDDRARDDDIIDLATHLNAKSLGAILYDPWLGWELGYYLGAWSDKRRVHYPSSETLADDALLNPDLAPRYFIVPRERDVTRWLEALEKNDFIVALDWENTRYVVFELIPPEIVGQGAEK